MLLISYKFQKFPNLAKEKKWRSHLYSSFFWKRKGKVFDIKHFENGTDGNQLLTTGTFDFINDTYKCNVRVIKD